MKSTNVNGNEAIANPAESRSREVCWRVPGGWMVYGPTKRKNGQGKPLETSAVYYRPDGVPFAFQYLLSRRPPKIRVID